MTPRASPDDDIDEAAGVRRRADPRFMALLKGHLRVGDVTYADRNAPLAQGDREPGGVSEDMPSAASAWPGTCLVKHMVVGELAEGRDEADICSSL